LALFVFRKCTEEKVIEDLEIPFPITRNGKLDLTTVREIGRGVPDYEQLLDIIDDKVTHPPGAVPVHTKKPRCFQRDFKAVVWAGIEPATQGFSVLCSTD
jgi:hypothetical protein